MVQVRHEKVHCSRGCASRPAFDPTQAESGMRKTPDTSRLSRQPEERFVRLPAVPAVFRFQPQGVAETVISGFARTCAEMGKRISKPSPSAAQPPRRSAAWHGHCNRSPRRVKSQVNVEWATRKRLTPRPDEPRLPGPVPNPKGRWMVPLGEGAGGCRNRIATRLRSGSVVT